MTPVALGFDDNMSSRSALPTKSDMEMDMDVDLALDEDLSTLEAEAMTIVCHLTFLSRTPPPHKRCFLSLMTGPLIATLAPCRVMQSADPLPICRRQDPRKLHRQWRTPMELHHQMQALPMRPIPPLTRYTSVASITFTQTTSTALPRNTLLQLSPHGSNGSMIPRRILFTTLPRRL